MSTLLLRRARAHLAVALLLPTLAVGGRPAPVAPSVEPTATRRTDFGVGRRELTLVDPSRPTMADPARDLPATAERTLRTLVIYPSAAADGVDAPAAPGRFPLVVFSHGLTATPEAYAGFFEPLVRDGYVVALPSFPLSSGPGGTFADYVNQPGDVSFVIDRLTRLSDDRDGWLAGRLRTERVGVVGHSMGGLNSLALAYNQCCVDSRIDAAVSLAGGELAFPGGTWDDPPHTPVLLVHGGADGTVPAAASDGVFAAARGPASYLRLAAADHAGLLLGEDGYLTLQVVRAFLDAELKGHRRALRHLPDVVARSGRADWQVRHP